MPIEQIVTPIWLSVSVETRNKLRQIFFIPRSSHAEVVTDHMGVGTVMSDGTTNVDLQALTVAKMQEYLESIATNDTVFDLFKRCVQKIETPEVVLVNTDSVTGQKEIIAKPSEFKPDVAVDAKLVDGSIKCEKCAFESKSKFAMRMHVGKRHPK